jgi:Zn-finger nucleic acid-binding protein
MNSIMQCTSCKTGQLKQSKLDKTLACHICDNCGGHWIKLDDYMEWHKTQEPLQAVVEEIGVEVDTLESTQALLCPESGAIMTKFHITSDTDHNIDWCNKSAAIWLDKGEWELLKEKGVADKLNQIFSEQWQEKIITETSRNTREAFLTNKLGEENYSRLKLVRTWFHEQSAEDKALMVTFLVSKDPFSPKSKAH